MNTHEAALRFAEIVRAKGSRGEGTHVCDGQESVDVPASAVEGRTGVLGKTFSGVLNLRTGKLRLDCAEDLSFWIEIEMSKIPALHHAPEQAGANEARADFEAAIVQM